MALPDPQPEGSRRGRAVSFLCWLYVLLLVSVWALVVTASEEWWPATLLMFLPRWIWGLPLAALSLLAAWRRPRLLWLLFAGAVLFSWQLMGFSIPWKRLSADQPARLHCRVLSCNVHRNPEGVKEVIAEVKPHLVALQDCPGHFGAGEFTDGEWHVRNLGQFLLASRYPIREFTVLEPPAAPRDTVVRARLETPAGVVRFYILHLASPRQALVAVRQRGLNGGEELQANSTRRRSQSAAVAAWIAQDEGPLLIVGDFNTPPDSTIYRTFWSKYDNAFADAGLGWGYTFHANRTALRIDHILAGPGWRCRDCWVGPDVGSEHRPVIADMELVLGH